MIVKGKASRDKLGGVLSITTCMRRITATGKNTQRIQMAVFCYNLKAISMNRFRNYLLDTPETASLMSMTHFIRLHNSIKCFKPLLFIRLLISMSFNEVCSAV